MASVIPTDLRQAGPSKLEIRWSDGHLCTYDVASIRRACRCAHCIDEWTGEQILQVSDVPDDVQPTSIEMVGQYALSFKWTDGHTTGIYSFEYLRRLCPDDGPAAG